MTDTTILWIIRFTVIRKAFSHIILALSMVVSSTFGAITAGGLAVVGFSDDDSGAGGEDNFVLLATTDIDVGDVIYFTNTAWTQTPSDFFGVTAGAKSGSQQLLMLTVNETISKGSILSTATTSSSAFTWTSSGAIGGSGPTDFSKLDLLNTGDQIYIFQSTDTSALPSPTQPHYAAEPMNVNVSTLDFVYLFDSGEPGYDGFNQSFDGYTDGMIPSGLGTGAFTANELTPGSFNNGTFGFNMSLLTPSGSASNWLELIANSSNWSSGSMPTVGVSAVPEPSRVMLLGISLGALAFRRRRNVNKRS